MLLKRFATEQRKIVMVDRRPPHSARLTSVKNACAECGFYSIPTEELEEGARDGHDPEDAELWLADLEGGADPLVTGLVDGRFPPTPEERFTIALFTAMQMTRGWRFRDDMNDVSTAVIQNLVPDIPPTVIRDWLRDHGEPHDDRAVRSFRERMLRPDNSPQVTMTQAFAVHQALRTAVEGLTERLFLRPWRLLRFDHDVLLISDNPVGIWSPAPRGISPTVGRGNASMIFLPLDRRTALAFASHGTDKVSHPGPTRARQINLSVIEDARRWIFHHPDDQPLNDLIVPPLSELVKELVDVRQDSDGKVRELYRYSRRAAPLSDT